MPRRNKYGAIKTKVDGIVFDSRAEARYYQQLKVLEKAGKISGLVCHPRYPIVYQKEKVCVVVLDFEYTDDDGEPHFVDVKGVYTAISRLKHNLFGAFYGQDVEIIKMK